MLLNCGVGEDSWESLGLQGDQTSPSWRKSVLNIHCKDWCWSWTSNTLAIWCEELTHLKRPWCWKRLKVGGEGDDRGWDGWMASTTQWTWVWASSGCWWWTGRPRVLQSMGSQRVGHDWATELNWTESENWFLYTSFEREEKLGSEKELIGRSSSEGILILSWVLKAKLESIGKEVQIQHSLWVKTLSMSMVNIHPLFYASFPCSIF